MGEGPGFVSVGASPLRGRPTIREPPVAGWRRAGIASSPIPQAGCIYASRVVWRTRAGGSRTVGRAREGTAPTIETEKYRTPGNDDPESATDNPGGCPCNRAPRHRRPCARGACMRPLRKTKPPFRNQRRAVRELWGIPEGDAPTKAQKRHIRRDNHGGLSLRAERMSAWEAPLGASPAKTIHPVTENGREGHSSSPAPGVNQKQTGTAPSPPERAPCPP